MNFINSLVQNPKVFQYNSFSPNNGVLLVHNSNSEFVPFYGLNKYNTSRGFNYTSSTDSVKVLEDIQKLGTYFRNICNFEFGVTGAYSRAMAIGYLRGKIKEELIRTFSSDFNFYYGGTYNYLAQKDYFTDNLSSQTVRATKSFNSVLIEVLFRNQFLLDNTNGKILYSLVIKKKYIDVAKYLMILNKEIPLDWVELWIRKDFINNPVYSTLFTNFRSSIINPCIEDNIEIKILEDFSTLFKKLELPKVKSLKAQKELGISLSKEFLEYKRKSTSPLLRVQEVQNGQGIRAQIISDEYIPAPLTQGVFQEAVNAVYERGINAYGTFDNSIVQRLSQEQNTLDQARYQLGQQIQLDQLRREETDF